MIHLTDVTLRDGLQQEARHFSREEKLGLLEKLVLCRYDRLELSSFVNPKWVPQFEGAEAFCQAATERFSSGTCPEWMAFVPNAKGLLRLLSLPIPWVSTFIAASETFNKKNVNQTIAATLIELAAIISQARDAGRKVRIYVSTVFGCPYEGTVPFESLMALLEKIAALQPDEIALSDTIGVALPSQVTTIVSRFSKIFPVEKIALHFHNTYGLALGAALSGIALGVTRFDGSTGGVGGCPYAKGATGNVALEDLQYAFFRDHHGGAPLVRELAAVHAVLKKMGLVIHSRLGEILEKGGKIYGLEQ